MLDAQFQGVAGVEVCLYRTTGQTNRLMACTMTSESGWYSFRFPQPGIYTVEVVVPEGYTADTTSVTMELEQLEEARLDFLLE